MVPILKKPASQQGSQIVQWGECVCRGPGEKPRCAGPGAGGKVLGGNDQGAASLKTSCWSSWWWAEMDPVALPHRAERCGFLCDCCGRAEKPSDWIFRNTTLSLGRGQDGAPVEARPVEQARCLGVRHVGRCGDTDVVPSIQVGERPL